MFMGRPPRPLGRIGRAYRRDLFAGATGPDGGSRARLQSLQFRISVFAAFATFAVTEITENRSLCLTEITEFGGDRIVKIVAN